MAEKIRTKGKRYNCLILCPNVARSSICMLLPPIYSPGFSSSGCNCLQKFSGKWRRRECQCKVAKQPLPNIAVANHPLPSLMRINNIKCLSHSALENSFGSLTITCLAIVNYTKLGWNQLTWIGAVWFEQHH